LPNSASHARKRRSGIRIFDSRFRCGLFYLTLAGIGVFLDLWSKAYVFFRAGCPSSLLESLIKTNDWALLESAKYWEVIPGFFDLRIWVNTGGAFGMLGGFNTVLAFFTCAASGFMIWMLFQMPMPSHWNRTAIGFMLAGAVGNLWDRLAYGCVRDFLDFHIQNHYRWPTFNLADTMICVAAGMLVLSAFKKDKAPTDAKGADTSGKAEQEA